MNMIKSLKIIFLTSTFLYNFFFFLYIKMFKTSSAKLYQRNKEKLQKELSKRNQNLSEKVKKQKKWL